MSEWFVVGAQAFAKVTCRSIQVLHLGVLNAVRTGTALDQSLVACRDIDPLIGDLTLTMFLRLLRTQDLILIVVLRYLLAVKT